jgi:hypothetical protein
VPHPHRQQGRTSEIRPTASSSRGTSVVRQPDGRASFLSTGDLDGDDVHDNGPWSENGTWWTAVASENVDEVKEGIQAIEKSIKEDKLSAGELAVSHCDEAGIAEANEIERKGHSCLPPFLDRGAC